jgi:hypothetical protein
MQESVAGQYFKRPVGQGDSSRGLLCLVLALCVCCGTLPFLAHASPPDPNWFPGIYDDADYDDVIGLLTETAAVRELPLVAVDSVCRVLWSVSGDSTSVVPNASLLGFRLRSPPSN